MLRKCAVIQVQVTAEMVDEMLRPRLQLLSLTPSLELCLQHRQQTGQCFVKPANLPEGPAVHHVDEDGYQQHWLPILALEAAETAVRNQVYE